MGQEDDRLTQTFTDQQHLAAKYQELDTLAMQRIDFLQEIEDERTEKLAQDTNWRIAIDGKLQTILNLLSHSLRIGPSQTVAGDNLAYFGQYLITTQLRLTEKGKCAGSDGGRFSSQRA
jgi:hypothetical protein